MQDAIGNQMAVRCLGFLAGMMLVANTAKAEEALTLSEYSDYSFPWYATASAGYWDFDGGQALEDGPMAQLGIGHEGSRRWSWEGALFMAPSLPVKSEFAGDLHKDNVFLYGIAIDGLFRFETPWEQFDPYLSAGLGYASFSPSVGNCDSSDLLLRCGVGTMWRFQHGWAVRADYKAMLVGYGKAPNANSTITLGVCWNWNAD